MYIHVYMYTCTMYLHLVLSGTGSGIAQYPLSQGVWLRRRGGTGLEVPGMADEGHKPVRPGQHTHCIILHALYSPMPSMYTTQYTALYTTQ